jgi:RNA polymerase sigma-70 factor (ECF subfamily)
MAQSAERTDAQVVRDVLAGDRDAFRLLVRRYGDVMYAHALEMAGNADDAADLVQDAFVAGFRKLRTLQDPERVGAWLFRILANRCKDHLRRQKRWAKTSLDQVDRLPTRADDPGECASRSETSRRVRDALGILTPEQREAFVLKHVEGRSYEEVAAVMNISVAALKMRVHRARQSLRLLLEGFR